MNNKKGFTLVELLGVIVILSIVMLIAIPNITATLERSKRDQYLVDGKKMISLVEYEIRKGEINKPATGKWIKITLKYLATTDIETDPDGYNYSLTDSYVVVTRDQNGYLKYYVNLIADHGKDDVESWYGIKLAEKDEFSDDDRYNLIKKNITIPSTSDINLATSGTPSEHPEY